MTIKRIHIVGSSPRTGTTLLAEAMRVCFEIDHSTDHEDSIRVPSPRDGNVFLTKAPRDIMMVGPLLKIMPDLYVIYLIRDPRDIITSRHKADPERYWAGLKFWKSFTVAARKMMSHPRFIMLRYEDFVNDPDGVQASLMAAMPFLVINAPFSRYHELAVPSELSLRAMHSVRPIGPEGVGRWREHLPRVAGQLQLHGTISEDLKAYGYEQDESWLHELEGVEPDISPSYHAEFYDRRGLIRQRRKRADMVLRGLFRRYILGRRVP
jgi:hypothetical protein